MEQIFTEIQNLLAGGEDFSLATVVRRIGSAPRSAGAKMLVKKDGSSLGTVGGGILEAQVQELAVEVIVNRQAVLREFEFSGKDAATMDAICGGRVEVLVEWVDAGNPQTRHIFEGLNTAINRHEKAWLITVLTGSQGATSYALVHSNGDIIGELPACVSRENVADQRLPILISSEDQQILVEPINIDGTAYIFGAGHVSRSLAEFTHAVGFWTVVIDDRGEYASRERFPSADELVVSESFSDMLQKIHLDRDSYVVIVTRGHLNDRAVLSQVLRSEAGYIGMIGSRRKCELVYQELRRGGYTDEDIQRVHGPIGIAIDAETPEEIGVSIVAEMIQARARLRGR